MFDSFDFMSDMAYGLLFYSHYVAEAYDDLQVWRRLGTSARGRQRQHLGHPRERNDVGIIECLR